MDTTTAAFERFGDAEITGTRCVTCQAEISYARDTRYAAQIEDHLRDDERQHARSCKRKN